MAEYKVVCVERRPAAGHHHVTGVGVIRGSRPLEHKSVKDVRRAIKAKEDRFYTVDAATGSQAAVTRSQMLRREDDPFVHRGYHGRQPGRLSSCNRLTWYMVRDRRHRP